MKNIFLVTLFSLNVIVLQAQNQKVNGIVVSDVDFTPLKNVEVCINYKFHCLHTSKQGYFLSFISDDVKIHSMTFSLDGYRDTTLYFDGALPNLIKVTLKPASPNSFEHFNDKEFIGGVLSVGVDHAKFDFGEFDYYFPKGTLDSLEANYLMPQFNYDVIIKRFQFGFRFGLGGGGENEALNDSVQTSTRSNLYDLHCSYNLLNTPLISLGPMVGLKWYRYRMQVFDSQNTILLSNYLKNREIDIRFNQLSTFVGINFMLKQNKANRSGGLFVGGYVGYLIPLSNDPWIRTKHNKIYASEEVNMPQLNFGFYIGVGAADSH